MRTYKPMTMTTATSWLNERSESSREQLFAAMREIGRKADEHLNRGNKLSPRSGEIAAGGAHFDELIQAEALYSFLRGLRGGMTPEDAADVAKLNARQMVAKWNQSRGTDYQTHRWEGTADAAIETVARLVEASQ